MSRVRISYFAWIMVFLNIALIVALTLQDAKSTVQLSTEVRDTVVEITNTPVEVARQSWWYHNIRKLGHIPEYLALGITTAFAWYVTDRRGVCWKALLLCAIVSISDQILKGLLPTREFDITDLPFDFAGYVMGIAIVIIGVKVLRRIKAHPAWQVR